MKSRLSVIDELITGLLNGIQYSEMEIVERKCYFATGNFMRSAIFYTMQFLIKFHPALFLIILTTMKRGASQYTHLVATQVQVTVLISG